MQSANAVFYSHLWPVWLRCIFSRIPYAVPFSGGKIINDNFFFNFPTTFSRNTYHSQKNSARYHKCTQFLSDFNETIIFHFLSDLIENEIFSADFRKILTYQISWKSVHWEQSCSIRTDRQKGMGMLVVAIRDFSKTPKNTCSTDKYNSVFSQMQKVW